MFISGLSNLKIVHYGPEAQKAAEMIVKELGRPPVKVRKIDNYPLFCALIGINLLVSAYDVCYLALAPFLILFFAYLEK